MQRRVEMGCIHLVRSDRPEKYVFGIEHLADSSLDPVVGDYGAAVFPPEFGEVTEEGIGSSVEHIQRVVIEVGGLPPFTASPR